MNSPARITTVLEDLRGTQRLLRSEFTIRFVLVVVACGVGWLVLGFEMLPLWVLAYYTCVVLEHLALNMRAGPRPRFAFWTLWSASLLLASVYAVLPVYLWHQSELVWKFGVIILFTGGVLNIFLLRARNWVIGLAYMIPVCLAAYAIAASFWMAPGGGPEFWSAMVLATCFAVYFNVCLYEAHRANETLRATREQFLQAQKVEAIGTLTSGVAHDFNNLLSVIQGNLELLQAYPDAPERKEFVSEALAAAQRGAQLTRQLTSYSRKSDLFPKPVDPVDVLQDLEKIAARVLPANIAFDVDAGTRGRTVLADPSLLHSALLNLVINARDAMPSGGALVAKVREDVMPKDSSIKGRFLVFEVNDTGTGIPEEELPKVCDPFYSTKEVGKGSGLGLPMVAGFAQQSGGALDIASQIGRGTRVRLFLPRAD